MLLKVLAKSTNVPMNNQSKTIMLFKQCQEVIKISLGFGQKCRWLYFRLYCRMFLLFSKTSCTLNTFTGVSLWFEINKLPFKVTGCSKSSKLVELSCTS